MIDVERIYKIEEKIAQEELGLNVYQNEINIISSEQMLDFYSTTGLPVFYDHWSFGKKFLEYRKDYLSGNMSLAFEIVINSDPVQSFLVETNTDLTQKLVIAHACFGHNAVFKNNYLFKTHARADWIIPFMKYASNYIAECEEKYGYDKVEKIIDSCHTLSWYCLPEKRNKSEKLQSEESILDRLTKTTNEEQSKYKRTESLLYFLEKNTLSDTWVKEIIRIVRKVSEYFYPQYLTKVLNEGHATATHYYIINRMYDLGEITEGEYLEFLSLHTSVTTQYKHHDLNPYAIGFKIFNSIRESFEKGKKLTGVEFFHDTWQEEWKEIIDNYRDDSFILQYLSEELVKEFKLMKLSVKKKTDKVTTYKVAEIHDEIGFKEMRKYLSETKDYYRYFPKVEIAEYDKFTGRLVVEVDKRDKRIYYDESFKSAVEDLWHGDKVLIKTI